MGISVGDIAPSVGHYELADRYTREESPVYLTGIQALVRILADRARADQRADVSPAVFVSGYEGSPLAGYDLELSRQQSLLEPLGVVHRPGVNEELAATAVAGTQLAGGESVPFSNTEVRGVTGFWYGKAPGLDRASDAIRHANLGGTSPHGGVVALVGDDPSAKSSTFPCSSELTLADLHVPTLYPADARESLHMGMHAVELSRASGLWAALKVATNMADGASTALPTAAWAAPDLDDMPGGMRAYSHQPHARVIGPDLAPLERSLWNLRLPVATEYIRRSGLNFVTGAVDQARVGIVAAGKTWLDMCQALEQLGMSPAELERYGIRLLKLGCIHPVEPTIVRSFAHGVDEIVVVEEKRAFLELAIKDILYGEADAPRVVGKQDGAGTALLRADGELDPDVIASALAQRLRPLDIPSVRAWLNQRTPERINLPLLTRTPYFCSGCPHNASTKVPDDVVVGGGIGCHGMVMGMPDKQTGNVLGVTQMGGEGAHWIGLAPFVRAPHYVQNLGDGTFAHSGSLAVRAAVAAELDMTYKLLFNSTVAMTGGQDAVGGMTLAQVVELLLVEGANQIVVTSEDPHVTKRALRRQRLLRRREVSVRHRDDIVAVQEELAQVSGVTVLVHDQECAAELRRRRKRGLAETPAERVLINERMCEGCGDCGEKSNCMSVHPVDTEFGRKTQIHQSSCNFDFSCLKGDCPSFLTVVPGQRSPKTRTERKQHPELPLPQLRVPQDEFSMRITGIGGTGVVTVAQVLATAAFLDGKDVRGLDQTGVAQKGGAVVSDVKIGSRLSERAPKVAEGECHLYLGCDALVAIDPVNLATTDPNRTIGLLSAAEVPTGAMVVDTSVTYPDRAHIEQQIAGRFAQDHHVDAAGISGRELGGEHYANMVMVGAAYQAGALPIGHDSLERAIRLNGTQIEANLAAFRLGREAIAAPAEATVPNTEEHSVPGTVDVTAVSAARDRINVHTGRLAELVDRRIPELVAYQGRRYAEQYADLVERVRSSEQRHIPGQSRLTETVAVHLFDLMAYKDEYEVARLALDPAVDQRVMAEFGQGSRVSYRLHPPVLRAMGMKRKLSLGPWFRPVFRLLYALRHLRGTPADLFGYAHVRKVERRLVAQYREVVVRLIEQLGHIGLGAAVEVAELPGVVRGYEQVKLRNVETYDARLRELCSQLGISE